jgi:hypothetical protein
MPYTYWKPNRQSREDIPPTLMPLPFSRLSRHNLVKPKYHRITSSPAKLRDPEPCAPLLHGLLRSSSSSPSPPATDSLVTYGSTISQDLTIAISSMQVSSTMQWTMRYVPQASRKRASGRLGRIPMVQVARCLAMAANCAHSGALIGADISLICATVSAQDADATWKGATMSRKAATTSRKAATMSRNINHIIRVYAKLP